MAANDIVLYHHPWSRSAGVRILLEALGVAYRIEHVDIQAGQQRDPAFLAVNPMGKLPALVHDGAVVTEQVAIFIHLADAFPAAALAPAIGDPLRGPYLRWMAFYGAAFEPAVVDRAKQRPPLDRSTSPYGDYESMIATLAAQLGRGDYILGDRLTAADILWGTGLRWTTGFGLVEATPVLRAYIDRVTAHPAFARAAELDAPLVPATAEE
ncbi:glutathione S-transferase family protein [Coralloluteibacterium thermophilus]|uniref:Glutathione S-transferase family protein n=1 Tax=Coralloluteibacterium thermophilum TaxID=2707049 RepID=A0ABV9NK65_9GAMM